jgi:hypothetical protein
MVHMLGKIAAIDQDIVEEEQDKFTKKTLKEVIYKPWKEEGAFVNPKGITRNS